MLADNLENWVKREREAGEKRGEKCGETRGRMTTLESTLRNQIKLKFGEVPAWADQRIQQADAAELSEWVVQILSAGSLEALLNV